MLFGWLSTHATASGQYITVPTLVCMDVMDGPTMA